MFMLLHRFFETPSSLPLRGGGLQRASPKRRRNEKLPCKEREWKECSPKMGSKDNAPNKMGRDKKMLLLTPYEIHFVYSTVDIHHSLFNIQYSLFSLSALSAPRFAPCNLPSNPCPLEPLINANAKPFKIPPKNQHDMLRATGGLNTKMYMPA